MTLYFSNNFKIKSPEFYCSSRVLRSHTSYVQPGWGGLKALGRRHAVQSTKGDVEENWQVGAFRVQCTTSKKTTSKAIDPQIVQPGDRSFNAAWLDRNKSGYEAPITRRGKRSVGKKLKKMHGEEKYEKYVKMHVETYFHLSREIRWWREGFVIKHGREPDWDDLPEYIQKKETHSLLIASRLRELD
mmetsp:Transcript_24139/g.33227  ORF Transcript_24139/g.33227 Transcript_24139/m.33227 type:complete len:187 (+) Transcript_24139:67-627(+)|eukprot:CAMPEP_0196596828 /NCGR_PEP_ID=MMETSP1081-20130531/88121_1 /TAXON_ID=36882 /ORGANISM="Pyramimonas amylifera, Strain CCMP720" /LENGTH=186 /DNA_ID=CAMNT_0041921993 /DNA_START=54 /DNA_END=614 /DNA_ORIENTATION=+